MGNKGAFITLHEDLEPKFTTFTAAVSLCFHPTTTHTPQPHPNVQPMAYASPYGSMFGF